MDEVSQGVSYLDVKQSLSTLCRSWYTDFDYNRIDASDEKNVKVHAQIMRPLFSPDNSRLQFEMGKSYKFRVGFNIWETPQSTERINYGASEELTLTLVESGAYSTVLAAGLLLAYSGLCF